MLLETDTVVIGRRSFVPPRRLLVGFVFQMPFVGRATKTCKPVFVICWFTIFRAIEQRHRLFSTSGEAIPFVLRRLPSPAILPNLIGGAHYVRYGTNHCCYRSPCNVLSLSCLCIGELTEKNALVFFL